MERTMNISLTPQLESFVKAKVRSGEYNNASEVIREALRMLRERDAEQKARLKALMREGEGSGAPVAWDPMLIKGETARRAGLAERPATYQQDPLEGRTRASLPLTKAQQRRAAVEERKLVRLRAAIQAGIDSPDDPDFSFDKLRASLARPRRRRS
ncbi:MAG TPA: type II toxin-antitoxin system ParD family antitoxin [Vineibacter sp.]|nr:type II toxin-antitoxin system ParD family antitoxin [Vineibacter sp.]